MKKITLFIAIVITVLHAQQLRLDECIDKALNTHPDIKRFALQVESSAIGVNTARADYLPQVSFNAEYDPIKTYTLPSNGVFNTKESAAWQAGVAINQKIWDFSKTTSNINAQRVQEDVSALSLQDAKALLAYKVKIEYELAFVQKEAIKVRQKDLNAKEELYKQAKAFVEQGMKTNADATRFLASVYAAKNNLAISQSSLAKAKSILSLYVGKEIDQDAEFQDTLSQANWRDKDEKSALQSSPALGGLNKNVNKNELSYKAAKASRYGSLDAIASYSRQDNLNEYDSTMVGVTLSVPLYNGGRTSALVEQAIVNKRSAEAEYDSRALLFKEEFRSLLIDLKRYEQTIKTKELELQASEQTQMILDARYKEGLATYIEVLDASALTLNARLELLQTRFERSGAIHRLEYLQGKII